MKSNKRDYVEVISMYKEDWATESDKNDDLTKELPSPMKAQ